MQIIRSLRALIAKRAARRIDDSTGVDRLDGLEPAVVTGVKTYSQRLSPPFSGQVQIAESGRARALTLDGVEWEMQFIHSSIVRQGPGGNRIERRFRHIANLQHSEVMRIAADGTYNGRPIDERIQELARHISDIGLPFPANDEYEYWLLDAKDGSPLAFIFSCADPGEVQNLPVRPAWTALPAAVMPIAKTEDEVAREAPPVNYRFERLISERAGVNPKAHWFRRSPGQSDGFPPLLVREDWPEEQGHDLCQRYLQRQATRLLMLHGLAHEDRLRLEQAARPNAMELARFYALYPAVADQELVTAMRVEARLRGAKATPSS
jgi:hypothetical protein